MATMPPLGGDVLMAIVLHADEVRLDRPIEHVPHGGLQGLLIPLRITNSITSRSAVRIV